MTGWALVTGASKGIGAATAVDLAAAGHDLVVHYGADREGAERTAKLCSEHGALTRVVGADLATDVRPLTDAIDDVGGLAVLVNNAGVTADGLALSLGDDAFATAWQVNVAAAFALCRVSLRAMVRRRAGRIVNVTSVVGLHGNAGQSAYASSKAGLVGLTKSLAREVGKRSITVNAVAPGVIATAMVAGTAAEDMISAVPAARAGTPADVSAVIAFLCSDAAAYVNGAVIPIDGGLFA